MLTYVIIAFADFENFILEEKECFLAYWVDGADEGACHGGTWIVVVSWFGVYVIRGILLFASSSKLRDMVMMH